MAQLGQGHQKPVVAKPTQVDVFLFFLASKLPCGMPVTYMH